VGRPFLLAVVSLALVWPAPGRAAVGVVASDWPPAPVLPPGAAVGVPESAVDGWPPGDPRAPAPPSMLRRAVRASLRALGGAD